MKTKEWYYYRDELLVRGLSEDEANREADREFPEPEIELVGADWKDTEGMAKAFIRVLKANGFFVYNDPTTAGSDWFGYVVSNTKLTQSELRKLVNEELGLSEVKEKGRKKIK